MTLKNPVLVFIFFCLTINAHSQVEPTTQAEEKKVMVTTKDGSVVYGTFVERDDNSLVVKSMSLSTVVIPISEIEDIIYLRSNKLKDKKGFNIDYHNSTRYFIYPSGYGLKKGQSYYENVWIFWNSYAVGVSDNFTFSASSEIASLLFASQFPTLFLNGKFSIPFNEDKGAFGINLSFITIPGDDFQSYTFLSGSLTAGSRNHNVTLGMGGGFHVANGITDEVIPITLSFMTRVSSKLSFVSENWLIAQNDFNDFNGIVSAGLRIHFKETGNALNIGLVRPLDLDSSFIGIPLVSGTVKLK